MTFWRLLALALMACAGTASADALLYGGAMIGQSEMGSETSTAASVYIGTGILPIIGVEGGYTDHGSFSFDHLSQDVDAHSTFLALRPSVDIGPFHIYARAGLHAWKMTGGIHDDGVDAMYGFGVEYFVFGPLAVGAAYNVYKTDVKDIDNYSISATLHFL